jgi:glycosyltransferase involved in cell wall biosynthesis
MKASLLFVTYNQRQFVSDAIRSAMAQDYRELELVVCDDASSDDTLAILEAELRNCPPHISVIRFHNRKNLGILANFNRGMAACSGEIIIAMAGDDVAMPQRVSRIAAEFAANPRCMLVYSDWLRIDKEGNPLPGTCGHSKDSTFAYGPRPECVYAGGKGPGSTAAYRAEIFRVFGPLELARRPEDRSSWVRALLLGEIRYLAEPLIKWRTHDSNLSNYLAGGDSAAVRKRIVRDLLQRQNFGRQFCKDIAVAELASLITPDFASRLRFIIANERERGRLRRYGMTQAPWKLWQGSALRLMRISPAPGTFVRIIFTELPILLFRHRRERRWEKRIRRERSPSP